MNNQPKIIQIENKIQEINDMLKKHKTEINRYENTLFSLTQQLIELKRLDNNK